METLMPYVTGMGNILLGLGTVFLLKQILMLVLAFGALIAALILGIAIMRDM